MSLPTASASDIIRSSQKDEFYISHLAADLQRLFTWSTTVNTNTPFSPPSSASSSWTNKAEGIYFALTTLLGRRTLGEEYSDLLEVSVEGDLPSSRRRIWLGFLQLLPYHLLRLLLRLVRRYQIPTNHDRLCHNIEAFLTNVSKIHLALFFLRGRYLHLSKRLAGVRYCFTSAAQRDARAKWNPWLAALVCLQLVLPLLRVVKTLPPLLGDLLQLKHHKKRTELDDEKKKAQTVDSGDDKAQDVTEEADEKEKSEDSTEGFRCLCCLGVCVRPTAAPCGHVYCWKCVTQWCTSNPTCPLCRSRCRSQELVLLRHYAPSGRCSAFNPRS